MRSVNLVGFSRLIWNLALAVLLLYACACVRGAPDTMARYSTEFDQLAIRMSPSEVRDLFPSLKKSSESLVDGVKVSEYRFQHGTMPRPGTLAGNFDRVPHYVWFYFVEDRLVEWGENRVRYQSDPDIVVEWRNR